MAHLCTVLIFLWAQIIATVYSTYDGDSFRGTLERPLAQAACYRLFSNAGDMGCRTSSSGGSTGAMFEVNALADIADAEELGIDLAYVIPASMLSQAVLEQLPRVQGVIVVEDDGIWSEAARGQLSPDVQTPQGAGTPQEALSASPDKAWNLHGNGLAFDSFSFPIVRADVRENEALKSYCADNRRYGYHSTRVNFADFNFYMGRPGLTSKDCIEWRDIYGNKSPQCIPMGGHSIWGTASLLDERPKVLGTVGIDSTAMFHDIAFGANDAAATIAAFLGAVEAIGRYDHISLDHQILLFAANAEEWGYAGSRRFAKDIMEFECNNEVDVTQSHTTGIPMCADPVYPSTLFTRILRGSNASKPEEAIRGAIALDQIGSLHQLKENGDTELYIHSSNPDSTVVEDIKTAFSTVSGVDLKQAETLDMPPTPLTSFSRAIPELADKVAVITGYGDAFNDPRYHSHYDNASYISKESVIRASELFGKSLITMAGGDASALSVNATWVSDALNCLLTDWNCDFFAEYVASEKKNTKDSLGYSVYMSDGISFYTQSGDPVFPPSYYTGVLSPYSGQPVVNHNGMLYGKFTADWNEHNDKMYSTPTMLEAIIRTTMSYHLGAKNSLHFLSIAIGMDAKSVADGASASTGGVVAAAAPVPEGEKRLHCSVSSDCADFFCEFFHYEIPMVKLECLLGVCVCPAASYHLALDPGLEAESSPGHYVIVDYSAPIYTEPNWSSDVGVVLYPKTNALVVYATVAMGAVVAFASIVYSCSGKSLFAKSVGADAAVTALVTDRR